MDVGARCLAAAASLVMAAGLVMGIEGSRAGWASADTKTPVAPPTPVVTDPPTDTPMPTPVSTPQVWQPSGGLRPASAQEVQSLRAAYSAAGFAEALRPGAEDAAYSGDTATWSDSCSASPDGISLSDGTAYPSWITVVYVTGTDGREVAVVSSTDGAPHALLGPVAGPTDATAWCAAGTPYVAVTPANP